jgi:hypothetical protein
MANTPQIDDDNDDGDIPEESGGAAGKPSVGYPPSFTSSSSEPADPSQRVPVHKDYSALSVDSGSNAFTDEVVLKNPEINTPHHKASAPPRAGLKAELAKLFGLHRKGPDNDWQKILYAHAQLNDAGHPVDETGKKEINLKGMDPEFGKRLAQTFLDMDAEGYQARCISGARTVKEQQAERRHYASIGSSHPVAGDDGPHVHGLATDVLPVGGNEDAFYEAFHRLGRKNGLEFVKNDINHCQIADCHAVIAQKRAEHTGQPVAQVATVNHAPSQRGTQLGV